MIEEFTQRYFAKLPELREKFSGDHPKAYIDVVRFVVEILSDGEYGQMDATRIHEIDDGEYQGTLVYVIGAVGYQPSDYWYARIGYGSCSGCDTLQSISNYSSEKPDDGQIKDYMTLALHVVQALRKMNGETA